VCRGDDGGLLGGGQASECHCFVDVAINTPRHC
jgi:hypothetical protein